MSEHGPAPRPCPSCPYRQNVLSGLWAKEEYEKLPLYDRDTGEQPTGAFFCHLDNGRLCAGWCGCHDMQESFGLRLGLSHGLLSAADANAAMDYVSPVPLFSSGAEAAAHGMAEIEQPGIKARRAIDKLERRRERQ